ncbi:hypothetical protein INQ51_08545 [Maribellus sp. CM-23]|uniref:hypothetical protein n=1 Tax=Maribellus sp. CM-23 TaxID=2781026 RepID=UPI001F2D41EF|nr:hypothetical protein [Maribellus sp. CM-23]MCE4564359.1 hypothetical protein [Maribellus sp. CM-23]
MNASVQKEGFNLSSRHDFGDPSEYFDQFQLLTTFNLNIFVDTVVQSIYYLETEDEYLQLVSKIEDLEFNIIAQFKRSSEPISIQSKTILKEYIKESRLFSGFPTEAATDGLFSQQEFNSMKAELVAELERNEKEALKNPPQLTSLFEKYGLNPHPNANGVNQWLASCPRCCKFYIYFSNKSLRWGCPYCGFHGEGEEEFRTAMKMVKNPTDENKLEYRINILLGELRSLPTEQERIDRIAKDIKTEENRYKVVSDKDYNLIFELLYGSKLEEIEPEKFYFVDEEEDDNDESDVYVYETNVTLKATNGFKLHYHLEWTEGQPETGMTETPYDE